MLKGETLTLSAVVGLVSDVVALAMRVLSVQLLPPIKRETSLPVLCDLHAITKKKCAIWKSNPGLILGRD